MPRRNSNLRNPIIRMGTSGPPGDSILGNAIATNTSIQQLFQLIAEPRQPLQLELREYAGIGIGGEVAAVRRTGRRDVVDVAAAHHRETPAAGLLLETNESFQRSLVQ